MDNLQKQTWHDRLLAVVWASCGILPLPFGAFASDRPYIASASILAFFILSFAVPLWLALPPTISVCRSTATSAV